MISLDPQHIAEVEKPWVFLVVVPPIAGFLIARLSSSRARRASYLGLIIAPLAVLALSAIFLPSGYEMPPGPVGWIGIALFVIAPVVVAWAAFVSLGFAAGRMSVH